MKKLIQGIVDFRSNLTDEKRSLFAQLALGQKPDALFIACSDSRVVPNLFASTNPGDLFVLRNMGNLIPPSAAAFHESGSSSVLEFSVFTLNVSDIIVCGHSECGAMQALIKGIDACNCPHLDSWLKYGKESLNQLKKNPHFGTSLAEHNRLSQFNVLQQMQHLMSYSFIKERVEKKQLRIHGWWFDIAQADVYCYEPDIQSFVLIEEKIAQTILQRMT